MGEGAGLRCDVLGSWWLGGQARRRICGGEQQAPGCWPNYSKASCQPPRPLQIAVRQRAGIRADSKLEILAAEKDMYVACINGNVTLKLGPRFDMGNLVPRKEDGWVLAAAGNDFAVWEKR